MRFNRRARLDSDQVRTRKGGAAAVGGGAGIVGVVVVLLFQLLGGGGGDLGGALGALEGMQTGGQGASSAAWQLERRSRRDVREG